MGEEDTIPSLPVNSSGIAGDKTVFSQNQPEIRNPKKAKIGEELKLGCCIAGNQLKWS
jgi:hypothetical protein